MRCDGKVLVCLEWWMVIEKKGVDEWLEENPGAKEQTNKIDKTFFWAGMFVSAGLWGIFAVANVLTLSPVKVHSPSHRPSSVCCALQ